MKANMLFYFLFRGTIRKVMVRHYGDAYASEIMSKLKKTYSDLMANADDLGKGNPMAFNEDFAMLFAAPYVASEKKISPEVIQEMMKESLLHIKWYFSRTDLNTEKGKNENKKSIMQYMDWYTEEKGRKYPTTFQVDLEGIPYEGACYYRITRCPICAYAKKLDIAEIMPYLCELDNIMIHLQHGVLHREKTIAGGDEYCDYFITGDKEKVSLMVSQVKSMTSSEIETACRKMADAFLDYDWTDGNLGMCEYLDREHFYRFTRGYFELALRNGSLYSVGEGGAGYMIFETPQTKGSFVGSLLQIKGMLSAYGIPKAIKQVREIMQSGRFLAMEMKKEKKPFVKVEFIAVAKDFQKQGYMRQMIDFAFSEADRLGLPCILTTDDKKKVAIYEHFGMKMVKEHVLAKNAFYYEMLREKS